MTRKQASANPFETALPTLDAEAFSKANYAAFSAMSHIGADAMHRVLEMNTQYLDFIRHRLDEDMKTTDRLRECSTVPEAIEVVSDFYKTAFDEYSKELADLGEMATKAAAETVAEVEGETKKAIKSAS